MTAGRTIGAAVAEARARLAAAGIETVALEARVLVAHVLGGDMAAVIGHPEREFDAEQDRDFGAVLARRARREPLAYVLGRREFWSLSLDVSRATLVPRPDSETLVEAALEHVGGHPAPRILDLGTGSGCLLIALLRELPLASGIGVDISFDALAVARDNARRCGVGDRAAFMRGDWADAVAGEFDLVIANPPYVTRAEWEALAPEVRDFEPASALIAGEDGLDAYRRIIPALVRLIAGGGAAFLELGGASAGGAVRLARGSGSWSCKARRDIAGRRRCIGMIPRKRGEAKKNVGNRPIPV